MNTGRMRIGLAAAGVFAAAALTAGRASGAVATNELHIAEATGNSVDLTLDPYEIVIIGTGGGMQ